MIKSIDLRDLYYAPLTADASGGVTYGAMVKLAGAIKAKITPKGDTINVFSDSMLGDSVDYISSYDVELNLSDLDIPSQAALLGHTITGGVMEVAATDQAPFVGIAFRAMKSNKKWRYVKLLKGKFSIPDDENNTREDKLTPITATIKGTFFFRIKQTTDEDQSDYNAGTGSAWFTTFGPTDTTPPTISSVTPANNATGVAIGTTVAWVFSEALQPSCVNGGNFALVKDADGSNVAGTFVQSNGGKTVTFTPSSNLTAAAAYRAIVLTDAVDLAGNHLAAPSVTKFTCA